MVIIAKTKEEFVVHCQQLSARILNSLENRPRVDRRILRVVKYINNAFNVDYPKGIDIFAREYTYLDGKSLFNTLVQVKSSVLYANSCHFQAQMNIQRADNRETVLMFAIRDQNFYLAREIINNGADLTLKNIFDKTALDIAKSTVDAEQIVELLTQKLKNNFVELCRIKIDAGLKNTAHGSAVNRILISLSNTFNKDYPNVADIFSENYTCTLANKKINSLMFALKLAFSHEIIIGNVHLFKNQINFQEPSYGSTLLMIAVHRQEFGLAKEIIENGADLTLKDHHGNTALSFARKAKGATEIVQLLEQKMGINVSAQATSSSSSSVAGAFVENLNKTQKNANRKRKKASEDNDSGMNSDSAAAMLLNLRKGNNISNSSSSSSSSDSWKDMIQNQQSNNNPNKRNYK